MFVHLIHVYCKTGGNLIYFRLF